MKKRVMVFFVIGFMILSVMLAGSDRYPEKITKDVMLELEAKEKVDVIVELEENKDIDIKTNNVTHEFNSFDGFSAEVSIEELKDLENSKIVRKIYADLRVRSFLQDSLKIVNASNSWSVSISNKNITGIGQGICILDSGINFSHSKLLGKNLTCIIDCVDSDCLENCSLSDVLGHGTHVAGIAAGVAPNISLISVKVLDDNGTGLISDTIAGIEYCLNNSDRYNISVISISFGTTTPYLFPGYCDYLIKAMTDLIDDATGKNISVVAATGNEGKTNLTAFPACIKNVTSVASANKNDVVAEYSNRNNITDLIATGTEINSTSKTGDYTIMSGTSMATPHVSAAFALIRQFVELQDNRVLKPKEIEETLKNSGKKIEDLPSGMNFSRIDIFSSILSLDNTNPEINLTPENNSKNLGNLSFICEARDLQLKNLSIEIKNSTIIFNYSANLTGEYGKAELNVTLPYGNYSWSCESCDMKDNCLVKSYDLLIKELIVGLIVPENNFSTSSGSLAFSFNVSSYSNLSSCSLFINGNKTEILNESYIDKSRINNITYVLEAGNYSWYIECENKAGNSEVSAARNLIIIGINGENSSRNSEETETSSSSSGGGGGSSSSNSNPGNFITGNSVNNASVESKNNTSIEESQADNQTQENRDYAEEEKAEIKPSITGAIIGKIKDKRYLYSGLIAILILAAYIFAMKIRNRRKENEKKERKKSKTELKGK